MVVLKKFTIFVMSVLLLALSGQVYAQSGVTFIVTKTADTNDGACDADCSLREAITAANATTAQDTIHFNIPGTGVKTISPASALPIITAPVSIDTTPSFWRIELDGSSAGSDVNGLVITAGGSTVKGLVINRFSLAGILLMFGGGSTIVENIIGTDAERTVTLGNRDGIYILNSSNNTIEFNHLSGNTDDGLNLASGATNNLIQGNHIGLSHDPYDGIGIGNEGDGVKIAAGAVNNHLFQNVIGFNTRGIYVEPGEPYATGNRFQGDVIYLNTGLGIDLGGDGVTPNDVGDADSGPNNLQNYPVLTAAVYDGSNTVITGTLNSTPNTTFTIGFYNFPDGCDPSGYGEGAGYGGFRSVTTDGNGNAAFSHTVNDYYFGDDVTATATDPGNNTSEFSACIQTLSDFDAELSVSTAVIPENAFIGTALTYTISITNNGPDNEVNVMFTNTLPANVTVNSITPAQGSCNTPLSGVFTCNLGSLGNDVSTTVSLNLTPTSAGNITNTATISGIGHDSNPANDISITTLAVKTPDGPNAAAQRHFFTTLTPTLAWNRISWATGYEIQVDDSKTFAAPLVDSDNALDSTGLSTVVTLPGDGLYYWRIRAKKPDGSWGVWSTIESFTVDAP